MQVTAERVVRSRTEEEAKEFCEKTKIETETDAAGARVSVVLPENYHWRASISVSIEGVVPRNCSLDLETSNGGIGVQGIDGNVEARTSNGAVEAQDIKGNADMWTSNGGIKGEDVGGSVFADTSNGSIQLERVGGPVNASTSNGRVTITDAQGDIRCHASNGDIELRKVVANARAGTSNGGITCQLPADASAKVSAATTNGKVGSDFPLSIRRSRLSGKIGDGKYLIELRTSNGNISVNKL